MIFRFGIFLALWLGIASVLALLITVRSYWPRARQFFGHPSTRNFTGWLTLGVVVGFSAWLAGNAYWQAWWMAEYFRLPFAKGMQDAGVWVNVIFRNAGALAGAYCFFRAFKIAAPGQKGHQATLFFAKTLGIGWVLAMAVMFGPGLL
ncbi:hypothetical protein ACFFUB_02330 [Algimonas porphyrae]|uniref:Uncharacterized protein n=1 Tax=Algimonas porphyrae TaxID=1128113 RepID=A0ABQ5V1E6_9PROT|nr:hypothetical protein [Algimonas porphyrae]GLQ20406.1 hypothetical protein GCM10007854_13610 [Algimonas porphyrae]